MSFNSEQKDFIRSVIKEHTNGRSAVQDQDIKELIKSTARIEGILSILPCKDHGVYIRKNMSSIQRVKVWVLGLGISALGSIIYILVSYLIKIGS